MSSLNKIVTVHSFRRSVGKSSLAANLASLLALQGQRVGLVDSDFQGASAHLFFGLAEDKITHTFNDFMWKKGDIINAAQDVTASLGEAAQGKLFLVPSSTSISEIMQILRTNMNLERYIEGLDTLKRELKLDILLVDTPAGLNENTLMSIAVSNVLVLVLHPDKQDFQGTAVIVDVARKLLVPAIHLVLNDISETLDHEQVILEIEQNYQTGKSVTLPHAEELLALGSTRPFVVEYPNHPLTARITDLAQHL